MMLLTSVIKIGPLEVTRLVSAVSTMVSLPLIGSVESSMEITSFGGSSVKSITGDDDRGVMCEMSSTPDTLLVIMKRINLLYLFF